METLPLSEVKARLSEIADEVARTHAAAFAAWEFIRGALASAPHQVGAPLRAPFAGLWRARRGEYRIRYRIDDTSRQVVVLEIDHWRDAYRR